LTTILWPPDTKTQSAPESTINTVPDSILDYFAASLPGPKHETEAQRTARIAARRAEILSYHPRDSVEVMVATQCILLGIVTSDARRDAAGQPPGSSMAKAILRATKQFGKHIDALNRMTVERQAPPSGDMVQAVLQSLGVIDPPVPSPPVLDPRDPSQVEGAISAIIVPLHPAPKMLQ
jgi:hypothetical protein